MFFKKMGFASWTINGGRTRKMRGEVQRLGEIQEEKCITKYANEKSEFSTIISILFGRLFSRI